MRVLKILGLILIGLVLFAGVAIAGVVIGGGPLISKIVEYQGSALLGREIRVGRVEISWGRLTRIRAEHIRVANAEWGSNPHMITIGRLELEIELGALLALKLVMPRIQIDDGSMFLEPIQEVVDQEQ